MSQFTNWLIETYPEYIKGSRILEQMFGRGLLNSRERRSLIKEDGEQGGVTNYICPFEIFDEIRRLKIPGYIITRDGERYWIDETMMSEAQTIDKKYYPISNDDLKFSPKEREEWKKLNPGATDGDIDNMILLARKYLSRTTFGAIATWIPGQFEATRNQDNAIRNLMKWKDWIWIQVSFPPNIQVTMGNVAVPGKFPSLGLRNLLVIDKKTFEKYKNDPKYDDMEAPKYGTPPVDPSEAPKPADDKTPTPKPPEVPTPPPPPPPGPGAPGGAAPGGRIARSLNQDDLEERLKQLKITHDALKQKEAEIAQREKIEQEKRKKEVIAKAAAGGAGAAAVGAARPAGAGAGGAGATGAGAGGAAPGAFSPDDIFGKEPEKVNPLTTELARFQIKNVRKNITNSMAKVVNHFSDLGLEIYIRGGNLVVLDASKKDAKAAVLYNAMLDNTNPKMEAPIWKQLWKASLQSNIKNRLGGKDLQQILGEMGSKLLDTFDSPDDMKTAELYRGNPEVYDRNYLDRDTSARFHNKSGN
jgi:hypothetical protein